MENKAFAALPRLQCASYALCDHTVEMSPDLILFYASGFVGIRQEHIA